MDKREARRIGEVERESVDSLLCKTTLTIHDLDEIKIGG